MKAAQRKENGLVEILLRATVYDHLRGVMRRFALGDDTAEDADWLSRFLSDLERRDAENCGVN